MLERDKSKQYILTFKEWRELIDEFREQTELRLGQLCCNKFDIQDSSLFYEKDNNKAISIIWNYYVNLEAKE